MGPPQNTGPPMPSTTPLVGPFNHNGFEWRVARNRRIYRVGMQGGGEGIFVPKAQFEINRLVSLQKEIDAIDAQSAELQAERDDLVALLADFQALVDAAEH